MQIIVHDTLTIFEPLFTSADRPKDLLAKAEPILFAPGGLQLQLGSHFANKEQNGFYVMQAAQHDGFHLMAMQQMWGLFNPTRKREVSVWQFEQFAAKNVVAFVEETLASLCKLLPERLLPDTLNCYLFPTDPANRPLMINNHGLSGFGFAPGHLFVQLWPSDGNLTRLQALLARLLVHNIRPLPVAASQTLADWLAIEGLAASFIELACPTHSQTPWLDWLAPPADWDETVTQIARRYGLTSFNDLVVNIYSSMHLIGADRSPPAVALDVEEREYARELIRDGINETDVNRIAAYLYGDEIVSTQGHVGIGLPPYAGFEIAYQMVQQYLAGSSVPLFDTLDHKSTQFTQAL